MLTIQITQHVLIDEHEPNPDYEYSFCFSYQGESYRKTNKMSLLRRAYKKNM